MFICLFACSCFSIFFLFCLLLFCFSFFVFAGFFSLSLRGEGVDFDRLFCALLPWLFNVPGYNCMDILCAATL